MSVDDERAGELMDAELDQAIKNFRSSVHAWSEAEFGRARSIPGLIRQRSWRLAAGWALGCVLVAGSVGGGVYERHHQQQIAKVAAARAAEQQRQIAARKAQQEEELLAQVDSDETREVPSAMEPLAQLMGGDENK